MKNRRCKYRPNNKSNTVDHIPGKRDGIRISNQLGIKYPACRQCWNIAL